MRVEYLQPDTWTNVRRAYHQQGRQPKNEKMDWSGANTWIWSGSDSYFYWLSCRTEEIPFSFFRRVLGSGILRICILIEGSCWGRPCAFLQVNRDLFPPAETDETFLIRYNNLGNPSGTDSSKNLADFIFLREGHAQRIHRRWCESSRKLSLPHALGNSLLVRKLPEFGVSL